MSWPWIAGRDASAEALAGWKASGIYKPGHLWHVLRHTYASVLAAGGVRRHELEQLMCHITPGTTGIYTHLFRESYESVHEALDRVYGSDRVPLRVVAADREQEANLRSASGVKRF